MNCYGTNIEGACLVFMHGVLLQIKQVTLVGRVVREAG